jgi:hypothetical protein
MLKRELYQGQRLSIEALKPRGDQSHHVKKVCRHCDMMNLSDCETNFHNNLPHTIPKTHTNVLDLQES